MQGILALTVSTIAAIAAVASAFAAIQLNDIEQTQRQFTRKLNAAMAMQVWQASVSERAASGYRCQLFLSMLVNRQKLFHAAMEKEPYSIEDKEEQRSLKACLDRENKKSLPELTRLLDPKATYSPKSISVPEDVSRFVTTSALDYLNFTEGVFLQWKHEVADRCILVSQLGKQASQSMRAVVGERAEYFTGLAAFFKQYPSTAAVEKAVAECEGRWEEERKKAKP
ncbi:exported hypothetical protein [Rubrivivax sp. A210]|uniref:hypothetical protein n=1 Tax=Rubrivivax sp. A210 TaxID=2772301 RepID=UPI001917D3F7|nr:hypothetical protein [Rubrivivax sp. A210]CAD5373046.1 exported hypothetical protein [Rubrivivax sp. A210]